MNEKPDILLTDYYFPYNKKIIKGYIYLHDGLITEINEGEPPEDLKKTDIHLPGKNQLLLPGLANMLVHLLYYPVRGLIGKNLHFDKTWQTISGLKEKEALALAKTVIKILLEKGVTTIVSMDPLPETIMQALKETGLRGIVITEKDIPVDNELVKTIIASPWDDTGNTRRIKGEYGETKGMILDGKNVLIQDKIENTFFVGTGHNTSLDPKGIYNNQDPWKTLGILSLNAISYLTGKPFVNGLSKGMPADLYSINQYSGLTGKPNEKTLLQLLNDSYHAPYIETVIVNGEILVDAGQQLVIEEKYVVNTGKTIDKIIHFLFPL